MSSNCLYCGNGFECADKRGTPKKYCSATCKRLSRNAVERDRYNSGERQGRNGPRCMVSFPECDECSRVYCRRSRRPSVTNVCPSIECQRITRNRRMREYLRETGRNVRPKLFDIVCAECGGNTKSATVDGRYCSLRCCGRANGRRGYDPLTDVLSTANATRHQRRRDRLKAAFVETVDPLKVFAADNYRCHLCHRKTLRTKKVPHPRAPTVDHIVPLAKGGTHEPRNCRTACYRCNVVKCDGGGGEQLLLIG